MNICPHCGGNQFIDREGSIVCAFCGTQVGQRQVVTVQNEGNEGIPVDVATAFLADISFLVGFLLIIATIWNNGLLPILAAVLSVALLLRIIRLSVSRVSSGYHTWMFFNQAVGLLIAYIRLLQLR